MPLSVAAAGSVNILGCVLIYLAAPRQQLWPTPPTRLRTRLLLLAGLAALIAAFALYGGGLRGGARIYVLITVCMTVWVLLPFGAALCRVVRPRP